MMRADWPSCRELGIRIQTGHTFAPRRYGRPRATRGGLSVTGGWDGISITPAWVATRRLGFPLGARCHRPSPPSIPLVSVWTTRRTIASWLEVDPVRERRSEEH